MNADRSMEDGRRTDTQAEKGHLRLVGERGVCVLCEFAVGTDRHLPIILCVCAVGRGGNQKACGSSLPIKFIMADTAHSRESSEMSPLEHRRRLPSATHVESRWPLNEQCDVGRPLCSEQIHLQLGAPGEMVVVFATRDDTVAPSVQWRRAGDPPSRARDSRGTTNIVSSMLYVDEMLINPAIGPAGASKHEIVGMQNSSAAGRPHKHKVTPGEIQLGEGEYNNPNMYYESPIIHTVTLSPLVGGVTYRYSVSGDAREFEFTMPPEGGASYPFVVGLTADLGQTQASEANVALLRKLLDASSDASDGPGAHHASGRLLLLAGDLSYADGWHPRWDSFGRMIEPLAARVPVMTTPGNHELVPNELFAAYNARYPMPHASSGSASNLWWSRDVGPMHLISLCSYCSSSRTSLQYRWLLRDLAAVDRKVTPWLVVMLHVPWYHSNSAHPSEGMPMRLAMEDALYAAGADLVLAGHIHAYERTVPVYAGVPNPCGIVHLTLGDGGNREGAGLPWQMPQPHWSAFREGTFGVGALTIINETHALYNWSRSSCETADAHNRIDFDRETCHAVALGPWQFGRDDPSNGNAPSDPTWIVRQARRDKCPPPASGSWIAVEPTVVVSAAMPLDAGGNLRADQIVPFGALLLVLAGIGFAVRRPWVGSMTPADGFFKRWKRDGLDDEMACAPDHPYIEA